MLVHEYVRVTHYSEHSRVIMHHTTATLIVGPSVPFHVAEGPSMRDGIRRDFPVNEFKPEDKTSTPTSSILPSCAGTYSTLRFW